MRKFFIYFLLLIIISAASIYFGYSYFQKQRDADLVLMNKKLDELFDKNISIRDGEKIEVAGFYSEDRMSYTITSGGYNVYTLTKESNGFVKDEKSAKNIDFKESEGTWVPPSYWDGYLISKGYFRSNYRPTVQTVVDRSFDFLLKGNDKEDEKGYSPNKLTDIKNFPESFNTKYHRLVLTRHPSESYTVYNTAGSVYSSSYEIHYSETKTYYDIKENAPAINKARIYYLLLSLGAGLALCALIFALIKFLNPKTAHKDILDVKWRNRNDNSIVTLHQKMFGKLSVSILQNGKVQNGTAKIKGNNLEINSKDSEYYFEIVNKEKDMITLYDLVNNNPVVFEKLVFKKATHDELKTGTNEAVQTIEN